jgi:hypothetical protein
VRLPTGPVSCRSREEKKPGFCLGTLGGGSATQLGPQRNAVFFDIGGTLGRVSGADPVEFKPFASSAALLQSMGQALGLKVGVITKIPHDMTDADVRRIFEAQSVRHDPSRREHHRAYRKLFCHPTGMVAICEDLPEGART